MTLESTKDPSQFSEPAETVTYKDPDSERFRAAFKKTALAEGIVPYLGECGRTREHRPLFTCDGLDISHE